MSSAASRVFAVEELVELILMKLPPCDILAIARTNRLVAHTTNCARLQRRLGFMHSNKVTKADFMKCLGPTFFDGILRYDTGGGDMDTRGRLIKICPSLEMLSRSEWNSLGGERSLSTYSAETYQVSPNSWTGFSIGAFHLICMVWKKHDSQPLPQPVLRFSCSFRRPNGDGTPSPRRHYGIEHSSGAEHQYRPDASWTKMKILNVAMAVCVEVDLFDARQPLFSPPTKGIVIGDSIEQTFETEEATMGNLLNFLQRVENECRRVNANLWAGYLWKGQGTGSVVSGLG